MTKDIKLEEDADGFEIPTESIKTDEALTDTKVTEDQQKQDADKRDVFEPNYAAPERVATDRVVYSQYSYTLPKVSGRGITVSMPADLPENAEATLAAIGNQRKDTSEAERKWSEVVQNGYSMHSLGGVFQDALADKSKKFTDKAERDGIRLGHRHGRLANTAGSVIEGDVAVLKATTYFGGGEQYTTLLPHSGFYVTFRPPADSEMVLLTNAVHKGIYDLGRGSYGLAFSNINVLTVDIILNSLLGHIFRTSIKATEVSTNDLLKYIDVMDLNVLLHGFMSAWFPRGFEFERGCTANPEKCSHVETGTLNVGKMIKCAFELLDDKQFQHLNNIQPGSMSLESVEKYQETALSRIKRSYVFNEGTEHEVEFVLKSCSIEDHIHAGRTWLGGITRAVESALTLESEVKERNAVMVQQAQATVMRQYSHFVESIRLADDSTIVDRDSIANVLARWTTNDDLRVFFIDSVKAFINQATIAVVGMPVYKCSNCGEKNESNLVYPNIEEFIPIDPMQLFFDLLTLVVQRILKRQ